MNGAKFWKTARLRSRRGDYTGDSKHDKADP
jgi:hypothetical protein